MVSRVIYYGFWLLVLLELQRGWRDPFVATGSGGLAEDFADQGAADSVRAGDLAQAVSGLPITDDGAAIYLQRPAADMPALELGAPHAGAHPFNNKVAFQLGDGADDDHHGPAQRSARIDIFAEADELDVEMIELVQDFQEVADGAGQAVERPYNDDLEPAMAGRRPSTGRGRAASP